MATAADPEQRDRFRVGTGRERPHAPGRRDRVRDCRTAGREGHRLDRQPVPRGAQRTVDVGPYEFSRTLDAFLQSIAANEPRGLFPRYLCGEQTYWTSVGSARGGVTQALLNEEGMLEVDRGAFSIEPFLYVDDKLVTWADGSPTQDLE